MQYYVQSLIDGIPLGDANVNSLGGGGGGGDDDGNGNANTEEALAMEIESGMQVCQGRGDEEEDALRPVFVSSETSVAAAKAAKRKSHKRQTSLDDSNNDDEDTAPSAGMIKARKAHKANSTAGGTGRTKRLTTEEAALALQRSLLDNAGHGASTSSLASAGGTAKRRTGATKARGGSKAKTKKNASKVAQLRQKYGEQKRRADEQAESHLRTLWAQQRRQQQQQQRPDTELSSLDASQLAAATASAVPPARPELGILDIPFSVVDAPRHSGEPFAIASLRLRLEQATLARQLLEQNRAIREAMACASSGGGGGADTLPADVIRLIVAKLDESEHTCKQMCAVSAHMQSYCEERARLLLQHVMLSRASWNIHTGVVAQTGLASTATAPSPSPSPSVPAATTSATESTAATTAATTEPDNVPRPLEDLPSPQTQSQSQSQSQAPPAPPPRLGAFTAVRAVPPLAPIDSVNGMALFDPTYKTFTAAPHALCRR